MEPLWLVYLGPPPERIGGDRISGERRRRSPPDIAPSPPRRAAVRIPIPSNTHQRCGFSVRASPPVVRSFCFYKKTIYLRAGPPAIAQREQPITRGPPRRTRAGAFLRASSGGAAGALSCPG